MGFKFAVLLVSALVLFVACTNSKVSSSDPAVPPAELLDGAKYSKLNAMDETTLAQKAAVGDLGQCYFQDVGFGECNGETWSLNIKNIGLYYPAMTKVSRDSESCFDAVARNVKNALAEGFCFWNHVDYAQMSDAGMARRAFAGLLGNCQMRDVGRGECNGETFVLYLKNKDVFFPAMNKVSSRSESCFDAVAREVRNAYNGGFCE